MQNMVPRSVQQFTVSLMGLFVVACLGAAAGRAAEEKAPSDIPSQTPIQFSLDRPIDAVAAPFVVAAGKGFYRSENLTVGINAANGPLDAIARVASGASDVALVDLNALIRYRDGADAAPVKAVFAVLNRAPYAIVARKSRGIKTLADMEGKTLGVAEGDLAIRLWPALAHRNGIKLDSVKQEKLAAAVREPMLSAGQVDAVTGFSYLSAVNLRDRGIPADDIAVLRYADYGCAAYGFTVIVNPKFAADKPAAVKGFLRAVTAGLKLTIKQPAQAVDDVLIRMDGGSRDLELERLRTALRDNIVTDDVKRDGLGGIDPTRFEASIDQIAEDFKFRKRPTAAEIFDGQFLPPAADRKLD